MGFSLDARPHFVRSAADRIHLRMLFAPRVRSAQNYGHDGTSYDWEELDPPDWITDLDREILAKLGNTGLIMTPSIIVKNIDRSRSSVSRRLSTLEAGEMVEKVERGHYRITDEGCARMIEEVMSEDWEEIPDNFVGYRILSTKEMD